MDKKGLILFAKFAHPVAIQCGCNFQEAKILSKFVKTGQMSPRIAQIVQKFSGACSCLKKIASRHHIEEPFNYKVVEAYFLGNALLTAFPQKELPFHLAALIKSLGQASVHHSLEIDDCRISWGKVLKIYPAGAIRVKYWPLQKQLGKLQIGPRTEKLVDIADAKIKKSDYVAIHREIACHRLTTKQLNQLKFWTKEILKNL